MSSLAQSRHAIDTDASVRVLRLLLARSRRVEKRESFGFLSTTALVEASCLTTYIAGTGKLQKATRTPMELERCV